MCPQATRSCDPLLTDSWAISAQESPSYARALPVLQPGARPGWTAGHPEFDRYLQRLWIRRGVSEGTLRQYAHDLAAFGRFLADRFGPEWSIDLIDVGVVRAYARDLHLRELKPGAIATKLTPLRGFCTDPHGPLQLRQFPRPPRESRLPRYLTESQIAEALGQLEHEYELTDSWIAARDWALFELLYSTGATLREAQRLNVDEVHLLPGQAHLDPGGPRDRWIRLGKHAVCAAVAYHCARPKLPSSGPAFFVADRTGRRLSGRQIQRIVSASLAKTLDDPHFGPQVIRVSFTVHLLDRGAPLEAMRRLRGDASIKTTARYLNLATKALRRIYDSAFPRA